MITSRVGFCSAACGCAAATGTAAPAAVDGGERSGCAAGAGTSAFLRAWRSLRRLARDLRGLNVATSRYSDREMSQTNTHSSKRNAYFSTVKVSSVIITSGGGLPDYS